MKFLLGYTSRKKKKEEEEEGISQEKVKCQQRAAPTQKGNDRKLQGNRAPEQQVILARPGG